MVLPRYTFSLVLVLSALTIAACGGGSGGGSSGGSAESGGNSEKGNNTPERTTVPRVTSAMLQGQWTGDCVADTDGTSESYGYFYEGEEIAAWAGLYDGSNCGYLMFEAGLLGTFALGESSYNSAGAAVTDLDFRGRSFLLRPSDSDFANFLNADAYCGRSNWRAGEFQVINDCDEFDKGDLNFHDIVHFNGATHYLGDDSGDLDGSSNEKRPDTINYAVAHRRTYNDQTSEGVSAPGNSRGTDPARLEFFIKRLDQAFLR